MNEFTRRLGDLAADRGPCLTRADILGCGVSASRLRGLVKSGHLVRIRTNAFVPRTTWVRAKGRADLRHLVDSSAAIAVLRASGAVVSHISAAVIHGLDLLEIPDLATVTVTRPPGQARRGPSGVHIAGAAIPNHHVTRVCGVPVMTVARTVGDVARMSDFAGALVVVDSALRGEEPMVTHAQLAEVLAFCRGWPGLLEFGRAVEHADPRSESAFESMSRARIIDSDLPMPRTQVWLPEVPGVRVDFLFERERVVAEPDGLLKYRDNPRKIGEEKIRDARIRQADYEPVHYIWREMQYTPDVVISRIRAAFDRTKRLGHW